MRSTSPGAKNSGRMFAFASMKRTFRSPSAAQRSMATTIASGTISTATNSTSGSAAAMPAVKRPLPQPSSTRSSRASGISSRQWPRCAMGSLICSAAQRFMRGSRFFFFLIRMGKYLAFCVHFLPIIAETRR